RHTRSKRDWSSDVCSSDLQKQKGKNYLGVVIPVGVMTTKQMRRLAELAENYGSGQFRLTPWQNLLIPDVPDAFVETVKRNLVRRSEERRVGKEYRSRG